MNDSRATVRKELKNSYVLGRHSLEINHEFMTVQAENVGKKFSRAGESKEVPVILYEADTNMIEAVKGLQRLEELYPEVPVIVLREKGEESEVTGFLVAGAYDFQDTSIDSCNFSEQLISRIDRARTLYEQRQKILQLEIFDQLTGVYTRQHLLRQVLGREKFEDRQWSVLIMEIGGLKGLNSINGHNAGDEVLQSTASILRSLVGDKRQLCRWNGCEFMILMDNATMDDIHEFVRTLELRMMNRADNHKGLALTFGWAHSSGAGDPFEKVVHRAEEHLQSNRLISKKKTYSQIVDSIHKTLFQKSPVEQHHAERMKNISALIAKEMGFSDMDVMKTAMAGYYHDIGKIVIEDDILMKSEMLTASENAQIEKHPKHGYKILSASPETISIAEAVLYHHESWDGTGYPEGLRGVQIPLMARILAVADAYDVMTDKELYGRMLHHDEALMELIECSGSQFDARVTAAFARIDREKLVF